MFDRWKKSVVLLSRVVAAAMLFANAVGIAQACTAPVHAPAKVFKQGHEYCGSKTVNPNSCLQQCTADQQNASQPAVAALPAADQPVLRLSESTLDSIAVAVAAIPAERSSDPPPTIRFCSFLL